MRNLLSTLATCYTIDFLPTSIPTLNICRIARSWTGGSNNSVDRKKTPRSPIKIIVIPWHRLQSSVRNYTFKWRMKNRCHCRVRSTMVQNRPQHKLYTAPKSDCQFWAITGYLTNHIGPIRRGPLNTKVEQQEFVSSPISAIVEEQQLCHDEEYVWCQRERVMPMRAARRGGEGWGLASTKTKLKP